MTRSLSHLVSALAIPVALAQGDVLRAWQEEALLRNPALRATEHAWHAARAQARTARGIEDPLIGADVMRDSTRFHDYMGVEYMVSQRFPPWGARSARAEAADLEAEAAGFRYLEKGRETRALVTEAAWNLHLADARAARADAMARLASDMVETVRARYETGQATAADFARARVEQARMSIEAANQRRERAAVLAALNAALDAPPDTPRDASALPEPPALALSREAYLARARDYCCNLLSFDRELKARAARTRAARRERRPMVELRVEARQFEGRGGIEEVDTGVFVNVPWLWRSKYSGMVAEAAALEQIARAELEAEIRMTEVEISEWYARAENAAHTVRAIRAEVLPAAEEALEQAMAAFAAGSGGLMEALAAQRVLLEVQNNLDAARAAYAAAQARLEQIAGVFGEWEVATGALPKELMP